MQKDLSDLIYEAPVVSGSNFVNTHGQTELMTTILIAVPKAKIQQFGGFYMTCLIDQKEKDYESWKKRKMTEIVSGDEIAKFRETQRNELLKKGGFSEDNPPEDSHAIDQEAETFVDKKIKEMFNDEDKKHKEQMQQPGAIPFSAKFLDKTDNDGT